MDYETKKNLREHILFVADGQKLPCKAAFTIAADCGCTPTDVGKECNELNVKIVHCQLGCFE